MASTPRQRGDGDGKDGEPLAKRSQAQSTARQESKADDHQPVVVILGCTGVGKTKLSIELATAFGGEVVNADSIQVYRGLDIVSNKATAEELAGVPHHLLGTFDMNVAYNMVDFVRDAKAIIKDIRSRRKTPILAGGTHYYIQSLLMPTDLERSQSTAADAGDDTETNSRPATVLSDHFKALEQQTTEELYAELQRVDPIMANRLHRRDRRKILRSLEVFQQHGRPQSDLLMKASSAAEARLRYRPTVCFWLCSNQHVLDERLDKRVDSMVEAGLLRELLEFHEQLLRHRPESLCRASCNGATNDTATSATETQDHVTGLTNFFAYDKGILQAIGFKEFVPLMEHLHGRGWLHDLAEAAGLQVEARSNTTRADLAGSSISQLTATVPSDQLAAPIYFSCLESMKSATRRYARKQIMWVEKRFQQEIPGLYVYKLDSSKVEQWDEVVRKPAIDILTQCCRGKCPLPINTETFSTAAETLQQWRKHFCDKCDREFSGDRDWQAHIKSKRHRKRKSLGHKPEQAKT